MMSMERGPTGARYSCSICGKPVGGRSDLAQHLSADHEPLEVSAFAATTMVLEEQRDEVAKDFYRRFDHLKREFSGET